MSESSSTPEANAIAKKTEVKRAKSTRKIHKSSKPFGQSIGGKVVKTVGSGVAEGARFGAVGVGFVAKEGAKKGYGFVKDTADMISKTAQVGWKYRRDLTAGAVGSVLTLVAQSPDRAVNISREAYDQVVKQVGVVRNFGGEQPSKVEMDELVAPSEKSSVTNFDIVYPWAEGETRMEAEGWVKQARADLNNFYPEDAAENVLQHEDLVRDIADEYGVPADLLMGMAFVESSGDPHAYNSVSGAKGLNQITDVVAQKYAESFGFTMSGGEDDPNFLRDGRFNPEISLRITAAELSDSHFITNYWGKDLQKHHMGTGNYDLLEGIAAKNMGIADYPSIVVTPTADTDEAIAQATAEAVRNAEIQRYLVFENKVDLARIFSDGEVKGIIADPSWDRTETYVPRILAAIDKIYEAKGWVPNRTLASSP